MKFSVVPMKLWGQIDFQNAFGSLDFKLIQYVAVIGGQLGMLRCGASVVFASPTSAPGSMNVLGNRRGTLARRGLDYLTGERGIKNLQSIKDFGAGYVNGTLPEILPHDPAVIEQLQSLGISKK